MIRIRTTTYKPNNKKPLTATPHGIHRAICLECNTLIDAQPFTLSAKPIHDTKDSAWHRLLRRVTRIHGRCCPFCNYGVNKRPTPKFTSPTTPGDKPTKHRTYILGCPPDAIPYETTTHINI